MAGKFMIQSSWLFSKNKLCESHRPRKKTRHLSAYKQYFNMLQATARFLFFAARLVIPACLRTTTLQSLHEAHNVHFGIKPCCAL